MRHGAKKLIPAAKMTVQSNQVGVAARHAAFQRNSAILSFNSVITPPGPLQSYTMNQPTFGITRNGTSWLSTDPTTQNLGLGVGYPPNQTLPPITQPVTWQQSPGYLSLLPITNPESQNSGPKTPMLEGNQLNLSAPEEKPRLSQEEHLSTVLQEPEESKNDLEARLMQEIASYKEDLEKKDQEQKEYQAKIMEAGKIKLELTRVNQNLKSIQRENKKDIERLKGKLEANNAQTISYQSALETANDNVAQQTRRIKKLEADLGKKAQELVDHNRGLRNDIQDVQTELNQSSTNNRRLVVKIEQKDAMIRSLNEKITQKESNIARQIDTIDDLKKKIASVGNVRGKINLQQEEIAELNRDIQTYRQEQASSKTIISDLQENIEIKNRRIKEQSDSIKDLAEEISALKAKQETDEEVTMNPGYEMLEEKNRKLELALQNAYASAQAAQTERAKAEQDKNVLAEREAALAEREAVLTTAGSAKTAELKREREELTQTRAKLEEELQKNKQELETQKKELETKTKALATKTEALEEAKKTLEAELTAQESALAGREKTLAEERAKNSSELAEREAALAAQEEVLTAQKAALAASRAELEAAEAAQIQGKADLAAKTTELETQREANEAELTAERAKLTTEIASERAALEKKKAALERREEEFNNKDAEKARAVLESKKEELETQWKKELEALEAALATDSITPDRTSVPGSKKISSRLFHSPPSEEEKDDRDNEEQLSDRPTHEIKPNNPANNRRRSSMGGSGSIGGNTPSWPTNRRGTVGGNNGSDDRQIESAYLSAIREKSLKNGFFPITAWEGVDSLQQYRNLPDDFKQAQKNNIIREDFDHIKDECHIQLNDFDKWQTHLESIQKDSTYSNGNYAIQIENDTTLHCNNQDKIQKVSTSWATNDHDAAKEAGRKAMRWYFATHNNPEEIQRLQQGGKIPITSDNKDFIDAAKKEGQQLLNEKFSGHNLEQDDVFTTRLTPPNRRQAPEPDRDQRPDNPRFRRR